MRPAPLLCCALLLASAPALADVAGPAIPRHAVQFIYKRGPGTESCPSALTMEHFLIGAFGYDPIDPKAATSIEIDVTRRNKRFHAEILITGAGGALLWAEEMDDPSNCALLMRDAVAAASIHTSIILDPTPPAPAPNALPSPEPPAPSATPHPGPAPAASPERRPALPPAPAPPAPNPWAWRLGAGSEVTLGLVPGVGLGGHLAVTRLRPDFSISAELRVLASVSPAHAGPRQIRGTLISGAAVPCLRHVINPRLAVPVCGTLHFGVLNANTAGNGALVGNIVAFAAGVRPGIEWSFAERFALLGFAELSVSSTSTPLQRDYDYVSNLWQMPYLGGTMGFDFSIRL